MYERRRRSATSIVLGVIILVLGMVFFSAEAQEVEFLPSPSSPEDSVDAEMQEAFKALENLPGEMEALSRKIREGADPMLRELKDWLEQTSKHLTDVGRQMRAEASAPESMPSLNTIHLEHADPRDVYEMLQSLNLAYDVTVYPRSETGDLLVVGPPENVAKFEQLARKLDKPAPPQAGRYTGDEIEVLIHVLRGVSSAAGASPDAKPLPAMLEPVAAELRDRFPYDTYEVADTVLLRTIAGNEATVQGVMDTQTLPGMSPLPVWERVHVTPMPAPADHDTILLDGFRFTIESPYFSSQESTGNQVFLQRPQWRESGITTALTVSDGQPTLAGSVEIGESDSTLFIVVTARRAQPKAEASPEAEQ